MSTPARLDMTAVMALTLRFCFVTLSRETAAFSHSPVSHPTAGKINEDLLNKFDVASEIISNIRNVRKSNNIANKVQIELSIKENETLNKSFDSVIVKLGNISELSYVTEKVSNSFSFITKNNEYFIPFGDEIDVEVEIEKLQKDLDYAKGLLNIVQKKLSNEKFVAGAPEQLVANERKKEADTATKIQLLEGKINDFKK